MIVVRTDYLYILMMLHIKKKCNIICFHIHVTFFFDFLTTCLYSICWCDISTEFSYATITSLKTPVGEISSVWNKFAYLIVVCLGVDGNRDTEEGLGAGSSFLDSIIKVTVDLCNYELYQFIYMSVYYCMIIIYNVWAWYVKFQHNLIIIWLSWWHC